VGLVADVGFGYWARHKLLTEFRVAATWRYERRVSWWKRLLGAGPARSEMSAPME
jgi:hypothetical protein